MIYGNWVAIRKVFSKHLPENRPYTKFEAVFSVSLDFDSGNPASYSGYSKLWKWSRNKVKKFMDNLGISILKPETPEEIRLQKGKLKGHPKRHPQDTIEEKKRHPLFVYSKDFHGAMDNHVNKKGQRKDTPKDTTIDPIIIPNPKEETTKLFFEKAFEKWWLTYPKRNGRRIGKKEAKKKFLKLRQSDWTNLKIATENYSSSLLKSGLSPSDAHRFLNETWKEYIDPADNSGSNQDDGSEKARKQIEETKRFLNGNN